MAQIPNNPEERAAYAREFGLRLQRLRMQRGLSQEKVAHVAGISTFTYQKFEKGESNPGSPLNPKLFTLLALAQALEADPRDLLG
jgi:transcriptional regulator with XRE-family HTH domain